MTENDILRTSTQRDLVTEGYNESAYWILEEFSNAYGKIHVPLTFLICIFGGVTNIINIIVLTRPYMITPSNVLLTGMSIAQCCLAVNYLSLIVYTILAENCFINGVLYSYEWTTYKWINVNLSVAFHTTALTHTTFLAIFRYIAVKKPHFAQAHLTVVSCKKSIILFHVLIPILCSPTFFITSVEQMDQPTCSLTESYNLHYSAGQNLWRTTLWVFGVVCKLIPSSTIAALSLNLIISLRRIDSKRERLQRKDSSFSRKIYQQRLSKMLLMVTVLCVSVEVPHGTLQVLTAVFGAEFGVDVYDNLGDFFEMLTLLYNSINFLLYCLMSTEFQKTFRHLVYNPVKYVLCCCRLSYLNSGRESMEMSRSLLSRRCTRPEFV